MEMRGFWLLGVLAVALLSGCATSPEAAIAKRIQREQAFFMTLPEDEQERLRDGRLEIGDSAEAARIVYGAPSRAHERITAEAKTLVWSYTREDMLPMDGFLPVSYLAVGRQGRPYWGTDFMWHRSYQYTVSEYLRIEFFDNKVIAIDLIKESE